MNEYRPPQFGMFPPVVKNLIICNVLFLIATIVIRSTFHYDITDILGLHYFESSKFKPYQLVSYLFLHDTSSFFNEHNANSIFHIVFNMFALWMFGSQLENYWGAKRFITFYLICGIGAGIIQEASLYIYFHHIKTAIELYSSAPDAVGFNYLTNQYFTDITGYQMPVTTADRVSVINALYQFLINASNTIGASGAIFGVLLAYGMLFPNSVLFLMFIPIPIKAKYAVMGYGLLELYEGIKGSTGDNVAHFAHLGGMLFGFILIMYWKQKRTL